MKIKIINDSFNISIYLPLSLLLSKVVLSKLSDNKGGYLKLKPIKNKLLKQLKKYTKQNGYFTFIEIKSDDSYIKIDV